MRPFSTPPSSARLLALAIAFFITGYAAIVGLRLAGRNDSELTGIWAIVKALAPYANLAIPTTMLYLWQMGSRRWLTHPAVILLVILGFVIGVFQTGKMAMAEPLVFYLLLALARYGWRQPMLWIVLALGLAGFQSFVFPISQYVRNSGGRDLNLTQAVKTTTEVVASYLGDAHFREYVKQFSLDTVHADEHSYFPPQLAAFDRIAMIAEADRLFYSTDYYHEFTGWDTITDGVLYSVPHFLYPMKPMYGTNNFLGQYTGDLSPTDFGTQISYGFFANWYNAFDFPGVLLGSIATTIWIVFLVNLIATGSATRDVWSLFAVLALNQSYVEQSMSGQFSAIHLPIVAVILWGIAALIERAFPSHWRSLRGLPRTARVQTEGLSN